jgi:hypothetical protein
MKKKFTCSDCKKTFIIEIEKSSIVDVTLCADCINQKLQDTENNDETTI